MTAVLEAIGMEKRFPVKQQMLLRRRDTFQALQGIDLALYSGQTLGVVGESGSGKSTLGEIFGDLQQPTSGIVRYKGQDIRSLGEKEYRRFNRGRIVEQGEGSQLIRTPKDDYTKRLIASSCSTGEGCVCGVR